MAGDRPPRYSPKGLAAMAPFGLTHPLPSGQLTTHRFAYQVSRREQVTYTVKSLEKLS
jgi:hypothetical protein